MMKKKYDIKTIKRLKYLRKHGYSLPELSKELNIPKTTVFHHVKNIKILPEYQKAYLVKRGGSRKRKEKKEKEAFQKASIIFDSITPKEKLILLSALYWGEGSKKDFGISNTDSDLIRIFVHLITEVLKVSKERLRISIRLYEDLNINKCLTYWSIIVGIPKEDFVSVNILKGKKSGKLQYGMCRVRILKGGDDLKFIKAVNKKIVELITASIA